MGSVDGAVEVGEERFELIAVLFAVRVRGEWWGELVERNIFGHQIIVA